MARVSESNYNEHMAQENGETLSDIKNYIKYENLIGADITNIIEDVHEHYEVATRLSMVKSKGYYHDLLTRLVKTYGH